MQCATGNVSSPVGTTPAEPGQEQPGQAKPKHYKIYFSVLALSPGSGSAKTDDFFFLFLSN